jgi:geranylgeranyl pyrophosphate synthase
MFSDIINIIYSKQFEFAEDLLLSKKELHDFIERIKLNELVEYINVDGGKLLRSIIYFYAIHLANSKNILRRQSAVHETAALIEAIHFASILHDDVVDNCATRRGKPSSFKVNGGKRSILAGDFLIANIVYEFFKIHEDELIRAFFLNECKNTARGALLEQNLTPNSEIDEYTKVALLKTAPLFRMASFLGAYIASGDLKSSKSISTFGGCFGIIYQVQNDIDCYKFQDFSKSEDYKERNITFVSIILRKFFDFNVFASKEANETHYKIAQNIINSTKFVIVSKRILSQYYRYALTHLKHHPE